MEESKRQEETATPEVKEEPNSTPLESHGSENALKRQKVSQETTPNVSPAADQPPVHEVVGGSSIRQYLNKNVSYDLLEGLRQLARVKPEDPLRWLGEYLIKASDEQRNKEAQTEGQEADRSNEA
ncbi:Piso0_001045 [Millerozyma farinosa CBS 7064]|uniref:Piso0_001045 protein n=1 Tax=Pichia sorbitophila (strain ATCC MYA-4447 / BCRC 22081 / CBS 7064 / NBRC 10061 / NRRL Y-12695) TaxID=559304 RepID=G8YQS3_PICSO|nr:Piso0_001045 [Millerozyma farinosa CBS 7064]CCE79008.1 Piso0_001045 [Millerozyma farinosa CBS 7064]